MKKSVFTFGLLASSLVMLGVTPFLNLNSFSNTAMAQGYDNYYGDSSYSTYPTDDKKYECRTGPFEGFFVSSVEFCKHLKFDKDRKDIRDNRTGTQGPPGPPGPAGATGPQGIQGIQGERGFNGTQGIQGIQGIQGERGFNGTQGIQGERGFNGTQGEPGPNQILASSIYQVRGDVTNTTNSQTALSIADCEPGDVAIGGSAFLSVLPGSSMAGVQFVNQGQSDQADAYLVVATIQLGSGTEIQVGALAHCFDNSP